MRSVCDTQTVVSPHPSPLPQQHTLMLPPPTALAASNLRTAGNIPDSHLGRGAAESMPQPPETQFPSPWYHRRMPFQQQLRLPPVPVITAGHFAFPVPVTASSKHAVQSWSLGAPPSTPIGQCRGQPVCHLAHYRQLNNPSSARPAP